MSIQVQKAQIESRLSSSALGLGFRIPHYQCIESSPPAVDYFEIISENFMSEAEPPQRHLECIASRYPIVLHGVGLNLLGHEPLDEAYLDKLCCLADKIDAPFVSDHLCWSGAHGYRHHDLLPTPFTHDLLGYAAERASYVARRLQRPFALENLSSYLRFETSEMDEASFYAAVVENADIGYMLDINNVYVSSVNHSFDPKDYIKRLDSRRIFQVHIAGYEQQNESLIIDTHDRAVLPPVWELYRWAWQTIGPFPTLLEWDDKIPPLSELVDELKKARIYQQ